jgi:Flp pilus assembly pilin Flp
MVGSAGRLGRPAVANVLLTFRPQKEHLMLTVFAFLQSLASCVRRNDRGVTAVEYALLIVFIGVALVGALGIFGPALGGVFSSFASELHVP